jgi:NAD(P)-dependent dehydrogenase (short-subunit alcohol dehydrogenase family)
VSRTFRIEDIGLNRSAHASKGLASEGYRLALGDLPSNQAKLQSVVDTCVDVQRKSTTTSGFVPKILSVACDVSSEPQVESLVQIAVSELGGIDVVCPPLLSRARY